MKKTFVYLFTIVALSLCTISVSAQSKTKSTTKSAQSVKTPASWVCVNDDELTTIYFDENNITQDSRGNYVVWVKTVYHTSDWQQYMTRNSSARSRVVSTKVKAVYNEIFSDAMVRDVYCYDRNNRQVAHRNESSRGWSPVNASDPVGIVGEYLSR